MLDSIYLLSMVMLKPITENFEETIKTANENTDGNSLTKNTVNNIDGTPKITVHYLTESEIIAAKKAKKARNELTAIYIFATIGIISCSLYLALNIISTLAAKKAFGIDVIVGIFDVLLFLFILKRSNAARKILLVIEYLTLLMCIFLLFVAYSASVFSTAYVINLLPMIVFSVFVICFLSLGRVREHFS
jgi:hypothetical protein